MQLVRTCGVRARQGACHLSPGAVGLHNSRRQGPICHSVMPLCARSCALAAVRACGAASAGARSLLGRDSQH